MPKFILKSLVNHANYVWSDGSKDSILKVTQKGEYIVTATVGACKATDSININYYNQGECDNHIVVYPNPFGDELYLQGFLKHSDELIIRIIDLNGRLIKSYLPVIQDGHFNMKFPTLNLSQGMYIIDIVSPSLNKRLKVVKIE